MSITLTLRAWIVFFGSLKWSHELRQSILDQTGLPISFGLSVNKTVAKIATGEAKPNGELEVEGPKSLSFWGLFRFGKSR